MSNYVCKIATIEEMNIKWDYEIDRAEEDKENWIIWKKANLERFQKGQIIPYYGLLDGIIICECTAVLSPEVIKDSENLINDKTVYLEAFRTIEEYQGQGYFSKLFRFMIEDLKSRGYEKATLGVEPQEKKNKEIYFKYGFTEHIKDAIDTYPDGTKIYVEYYGKNLK